VLGDDNVLCEMQNGEISDYKCSEIHIPGGVPKAERICSKLEALTTRNIVAEKVMRAASK
jgi:hypothetical protein